jgi:hypothetical protein
MIEARRVQATVTRPLTWLVDAFGGFCAGFLVWVVTGSLLGHSLARTYADDRKDCLPFRYLGGPMIGVDCEHQAAEAVWNWLVVVPSHITGGLASIAWATHYCIIGKLCLVGEFTIMQVLIIGLMSVSGFRAWRTRSEPLAWVLINGLVAVIAAISVRWP